MVGVGEDGYRDILGIAEGCKEDKAQAAAKLETMTLCAAAELMREGIAETLTYYAFPDEHHRQKGRLTSIHRLE